MEIEGNPKPQQRHRHFKYGTYDPCKKDKEDFLKKALKDYNYSKAFTHLPRLTPTECERLQGFPDDWTEGCSDTQRYKQLGNTVSVPVVRAIMEKLYMENK